MVTLQKSVPFVWQVMISINKLKRRTIAIQVIKSVEMEKIFSAFPKILNVQSETYIFPKHHLLDMMKPTQLKLLIGNLYLILHIAIPATCTQAYQLPKKFM